MSQKSILTAKIAEAFDKLRLTPRAAELTALGILLCGPQRFPLRNSAVNGFRLQIQPFVLTSDLISLDLILPVCPDFQTMYSKAWNKSSGVSTNQS
jgi:hypothetical protein